MSETPERKVLKEMLGKLKVKTINSKISFIQSEIDLSQEFARVWGHLIKIQENRKVDAELKGLLGFVIGNLDSAARLLTTNANGLREDFELYIDTLERYSTELDNTLEKIFESARKMEEEEQRKQEELRKKQEELRKRKPSYRA